MSTKDKLFNPVGPKNEAIDESNLSNAAKLL